MSKAREVLFDNLYEEKLGDVGFLSKERADKVADKMMADLNAAGELLPDGAIAVCSKCNFAANQQQADYCVFKTDCPLKEPPK